MISVGDVIDQYTLTRKLGEGAFGEVFQAEDGPKNVAIKFAKASASTDQFSRFLKVQSKIKSDHIVQVLDSDLDATPARIVMELVDGCTLRDVINKIAEAGAWQYRRPAMLYILREIAAGLRDAHKQGVSHLDLKPSNVLISSMGEVKLTDFEFSRSAKDIHLSLSLATTDNLAGTLAYMSPEQRRGKDVSYTSDIYTFGVLMFEVMTGELPQPGDILSEFIENTAYDRIFTRCFCRPIKRFADGNQLFNRFDELNKDMVNRSQLVSLLEDFQLSEVKTPSPVSDEFVSGVYVFGEEPASSKEKEALTQLCNKYLGYVKVHTALRVVDPPARENVPYSLWFMRSIEEKIDIPISREDDFRRELMNYVRALANGNKQLHFWSNERLHKALKLKLADPTKRPEPKNLITLYKMVRSDPSNVPTLFWRGQPGVPIRKEVARFEGFITIPDIIEAASSQHGPGDYVIHAVNTAGEEASKSFTVADKTLELQKKKAAIRHRRELAAKAAAEQAARKATRHSSRKGWVHAGSSHSHNTATLPVSPPPPKPIKVYPVKPPGPVEQVFIGMSFLGIMLIPLIIWAITSYFGP